jgi:hypothetical protein
LNVDERFEKNGTGMLISREVLEDVCKRMIRMILFCLSDAFRGTIYSVGPIPDLRTIRITSGRRNGQTDKIVWGVANPSDYDYPGKVWDVYRDRPGGILEAMAWCVEKQKSWTAEDPENNIRCVRKQLEGKAPEDYHHMEPVLVKKTDLWEKSPGADAFPEDNSGMPIWKESPYATVAVIKIHFSPRTIKQGDRSTRIIKELSRSLGTEMLSLHAREVALEKQKRLTEERQDTCNSLAHDFRNIIARTGFAYRAINNEISYLREFWENLVCHYSPEVPNKQRIVTELNHSLRTLQNNSDSREIPRLITQLNQLKENVLLPQQSAMWVQRKIKPLWMSILSKHQISTELRQEIEGYLSRLVESFYLGLNHTLIDKIDVLSDELKQKWTELVYKEIDGNTNSIVKDYVELLDRTDLDIPHRRQSLRNFIYFRSLIELVPDIESKLDDRLELLKNGDSS